MSTLPPKQSWWRRAWRGVSRVYHRVAARPGARGAFDVVPEPYRVLDVSQHSRHECERADAANARLHERRLAAQASLPPNLTASAESVAPPPAEGNLARHLRWCEDNVPVSADLQARAVVALLRQGRRPTQDYRPAQAITLAASAIAAEASDSAALAGCLPSQPGGFCVYSDDQLRGMSKRNCRNADRRNERLFVRQERRSRRRRRTLSGVLDMETRDTSATLQSNYQRRVVLKQRDVPVSAARQANAVVALADAGLVLYADYQPQNAIALAAALRRGRASAPPAPPAARPDTPVPPAARPDTPPPPLELPSTSALPPPPDAWLYPTAPLYYPPLPGAVAVGSFAPGAQLPPCATGFKPAGCRR